MRDRHERMRRFVATVSRLHWDGEELPDGTEYLQDNDDARETLMSLITEARDLIASEEASHV